ncbi:hypothetical protein LTR66_007450 [Elasticomyces elasticus]|nr:hypothetical protein LTR28_005462 [Elasticomyces elasticus]KAK4987976.1 hypothetical protein LTR66_007450 [Elasticomyces elasticus]
MKLRTTIQPPTHYGDVVDTVTRARSLSEYFASNVNTRPSKPPPFIPFNPELKPHTSYSRSADDTYDAYMAWEAGNKRAQLRQAVEEDDGFGWEDLEEDASDQDLVLMVQGHAKIAKGRRKTWMEFCEDEGAVVFQLEKPTNSSSVLNKITNYAKEEIPHFSGIEEKVGSEAFKSMILRSVPDTKQTRKNTQRRNIPLNVLDSQKEAAFDQSSASSKFATPRPTLSTAKNRVSGPPLSRRIAALQKCGPDLAAQLFQEPYVQPQLPPPIQTTRRATTADTSGFAALEQTDVSPSVMQHLKLEFPFDMAERVAMEATNFLQGVGSESGDDGEGDEEEVEL